MLRDITHTLRLMRKYPRNSNCSVEPEDFYKSEAFNLVGWFFLFFSNFCYCLNESDGIAVHDDKVSPGIGYPGWRNVTMIMPWWRNGCHASWHSYYAYSMITMFCKIQCLILRGSPRLAKFLLWSWYDYHVFHVFRIRKIFKNHFDITFAWRLCVFL